jgi:hypothetical protein
MASANVMLMAASVRYQRPAAAPWWSLRETASGTGVAGSVSGALDPPGCVTDPHWYTVQRRTQHAGEVYAGCTSIRAARRCHDANVESCPVCLACKIVKMTAEKPRRCERREGWR